MKDKELRAELKRNHIIEDVDSIHGKVDLYSEVSHCRMELRNMQQKLDMALKHIGIKIITDTDYEYNSYVVKKDEKWKINTLTK